MLVQHTISTSVISNYITPSAKDITAFGNNVDPVSLGKTQDSESHSLVGHDGKCHNQRQQFPIVSRVSETRTHI